MLRYKWTCEQRDEGRYWYNRNEFQGLQKEIIHLKDLLNKERDNARIEQEHRIQACNDLLETQQQLEKERYRKKQLIHWIRRRKTLLYKQRMMHRSSRTTRSMVEVIKLQAKKERIKVPIQGRKRQTSSQALIPTVKQQHWKSDRRNELRSPKEEERKQEKVSSIKVEQDGGIYWYNRNEIQGLQKEIIHLKDLLNKERDNARIEQEHRIQACNDLLETQQKLEKKRYRNKQLIHWISRPKTLLWR